MVRGAGPRGRATSRGARRAAARLAAGSLAIAAPLAAGSEAPDLVVPFTPAPIAIDGQSDAAWAAAETFFIGIDIFSIVFRALHDGRTLYLQVDNLTDEEHEPGAGAAIWFDDQGGAPPYLADGLWTSPSCSAFPNRGEGALSWIVTSQSPIQFEERWIEKTSGPACPQYIGQNGSSAAIFFEPPANGLTTEVALPLEGSSALELAPGRRFGLYVESHFVSLGVPYVVGMWPADGNQVPANFGAVVLAATGCNTNGEAFDPQFAPDWLNETTGGPGWLRSGAGGCGTSNATGGAGESACVVRGASTFTLNASLLSPWFSLLGQDEAEISYRAVYVDAPASDNRLDLEARTTAGWTPLLSWTSTHGQAGGELVTVDLSSYAGEARVQLRWRYSAGEGQPGLGAQVDEVRLRCSPDLFSDNFESGLTTRWSAEAP